MQGLRGIGRDLRIVFFVRIESRIESAVQFVFESNLPIESAVYHASRNTAQRTAGVPYSLLQAYNMLTTSIVNVCDERE